MLSIVILSLLAVRPEIALGVSGLAEPKYFGVVSSASVKVIDGITEWQLRLAPENNVAIRWKTGQLPKLPVSVGQTLEVLSYQPLGEIFGKPVWSHTGLKRVVLSTNGYYAWAWVNDETEGRLGKFRYSISSKLCQGNTGALELEWGKGKTARICEGQTTTIVVDGKGYRLTNYKSGSEPGISSSCNGGDCNSFFANKDWITFLLESTQVTGIPLVP